MINQIKTEFTIRKNEIADYITYFFKNSSSLSKHKFIIFAQYRTGSTLLADLLNSHPDIFTDEEIFFPFAISSYFQKVLLPDAYINAQSLKYQSKIYGFDLKIDQLIMSLSKFNGEPIHFIENLINNQWKIIYLKRNNALRKVISSMCAITRNQYTDTDKNPLRRRRIYIDCLELIKRLKWVEKMDKKEEKITQKIPCLPLIYEKNLLNSEQHQKTLDIVFNYLDTYSVPVKSKFKKISTHNLADDIENYDEVVNFIQQTKYSNFID